MRLKLLVTWRRLAILPVVAAIGALAVSVSGLVSIAANTGHFAPVEWFLHWTMQNAVRTQSLPYALPAGVDLSEPALVQRAAGHFASGCSVCHGAPGVLQSAALRSMTPTPPRLEDQVGRWEDRELFWIVSHGIKYSGMPSWTTQDRPDEVWAMVAFLRALPEMTAEDYERLAFGASGETGGGSQGSAASLARGPSAVDEAIADCARCHGADGRGVDAGGASGAFPVIAGQPEAYLLETLRAYASGRRQSGIMTPAASLHDDAVLAGVAAHYAAQAPGDAVAVPAAEPGGVTLGDYHTARSPRGTLQPSAPVAEPVAAGAEALVDPAASGGPPYSAAGLEALGGRIATQGLPDRKLPPCDSCHGASGRASNPHYPYLGGQPEWFLASQLQLFKDRNRLGTPFAHLMEPIAINLTQEQIDALALYYSRLPAGR